MVYTDKFVKASEKGQLGKVKSLILNNYCINSKDSTGNRTALHVASQKGHYEIVKFLLDNGASINDRESLFGYTAFHFAIKSQNKKICELLISKGFDISNLYNGSGDIKDSKYERLIKKSKGKESFEDLGAYLLNFSLRNYSELGDKNKVELLLKNGADINSQDTLGHTSADLAALSGNLEVLNLFVESSYKIKTNNLVSYAAMNGKLDALIYLKNQGFALCQNALFLASMKGQVEAVKFLLENGVDVNSVSKNGMTALHFALLKGVDNLSVANELVRFGIDTKVKDQNDKTAAYYARKHGHVNSLRILEKIDSCILDELLEKNLKLKNLDALNLYISKVREYVQEYQYSTNIWSLDVIENDLKISANMGLSKEEYLIKDGIIKLAVLHNTISKSCVLSELKVNDRLLEQLKLLDYLCNKIDYKTGNIIKSENKNTIYEAFIKGYRKSLNTNPQIKKSLKGLEEGLY